MISMINYCQYFHYFSAVTLKVFELKGGERREGDSESGKRKCETLREEEDV